MIARTLEGLPLPWRVAAARLHQALGVPGWTGMALLVATSIILAVVRPPDRMELRSDAQVGVDLPSATPLVEIPAERPPLNPPADVPLIETQIEHAALAQSLGWSSGRYSVVAAQGEEPATLQIDVALKGEYRPLRRFLVTVLSDVPGATLRSLSISRDGSDVAQLTARLRIAVFLRDVTQPATASGSPATQASGAAR